MCSAGTPQQQTDGAALIAVLWVTAALAAIALGYASTARFNGVVTKNTIELHNHSYLLESCLERGYRAYLHYQKNKNRLENSVISEDLSPEELGMWYPRYEPYRLTLQGSSLSVQISTPEAKFDMRALDSNLWKRVIETCQGENATASSDSSTDILNSLEDWQDTDSMHRLNGAENEYYATLDPAYLCKNAPLENIEELLLIKGIDNSLFLGQNNRPGLQDFLNRSGKNTLLDINCASPKTFGIIEGLPKEVIQDVIEIRKKKPILTLSELVSIIPQTHWSLFQKYYAVTEQTQFVTVTARLTTDENQAGSSLQRIYPHTLQ